MDQVKDNCHISCKKYMIGGVRHHSTCVNRPYKVKPEDCISHVPEVIPKPFRETRTTCAVCGENLD